MLGRAVGGGNERHYIAARKLEHHGTALNAGRDIAGQKARSYMGGNVPALEKVCNGAAIALPVSKGEGPKQGRRVNFAI